MKEEQLTQLEEETEQIPFQYHQEIEEHIRMIEQYRRNEEVREQEISKLQEQIFELQQILQEKEENENGLYN